MTTDIKGLCPPAFTNLKRAFAQNFEQLGEVGAAISLVQNGEVLVDLYAGQRDVEKQLPWQADTRANVWSTTKGVVGICFAILVDRGVLSYETKLAEYWPAFKTEDKQHITLAMLLSHQAGLVGMRGDCSAEDIYSRQQAAERLATMQPFWPPGEAFGYHAISAGIMASEFMFRVCGRSIKQFVAEEFEQALGLDISIGLTPENYSCAATMIGPSKGAADLIGDLNEIQHASINGPALEPTLPNSDAWRQADIPSANGFATATALAKLFDAMANEGCVEDKKLLSAATIAQATARQTPDGLDQVFQMPVQWACGFLKNSVQVYGPSANAFGHSGWGGSFAFADPDQGIGFAYTMNRMGTELIGDPRNMALLQALYLDLS